MDSPQSVSDYSVLPRAAFHPAHLPLDQDAGQDTRPSDRGSLVALEGVCMWRVGWLRWTQDPRTTFSPSNFQSVLGSGGVVPETFWEVLGKDSVLGGRGSWTGVSVIAVDSSHSASLMWTACVTGSKLLNFWAPQFPHL